MTDKELIALVETKLPHELSLEQLEELRRRLHESAPLREAIAGQLQFDQYLSAIVGHIELSPDAVLAGQSSQQRRGSVWSLFGWTACLLLVAFVAAMLVWPWLSGPRGNNPVADASKASQGSDPASAAKALEAAKTPAEMSKSPKAGGGPTTAKNPDGDQHGQPSKHPGDQVAAAKEPKPVRIEIDATKPVSSKGVQFLPHGMGGEDVMRSKRGQANLEYEVEAPTEGNYRLESRYALTPNPVDSVKLFLNGTIVSEQALGDGRPRGMRFGPGVAFQGNAGLSWHVEGIFHLEKGKNRIVLSTDTILPPLNRLAFVWMSKQALAAAGMAGLPWQADSQLGGPARPLEQVIWEPLERAGDSPAMFEFHQWFTPVGGRGQMDIRDWAGRRLPFLQGLVHFNGPWGDDNLLHLSLSECLGYAIHFWNGRSGLTLKFYMNDWSIAAYATDREGPAPTPHHYRLLATDDGRNMNTTMRHFPLRLDLRFHAGQITVSRGDLVLLRAPFDGLPSETVFDGQAMVNGLAMERVTDELPAEPDPLPIALEIAKPAEMHWQGTTPPGVTFTRLPDGAVELKAEKNQQPGVEWFELPKPGLHEVVLELDDVTANARPIWGERSGELAATLGFLPDPQLAGLVCRLIHVGDQTDNVNLDLQNEPVPMAAPHQWVKLIAACGLTKCYIGVDGIHWARIPAGQWQPFDRPIQRIGLWCGPGEGQRRIRLRRVELRQFSELEKLAPAELVAKAPAIKAGNLDAWLTQAATSLPAGVNLKEWQRACALRSLAASGEGPLGRELVTALLGDSLARPLAADGLESRLKLFHELALLTNVTDDARHGSEFLSFYERLGTQLARAGNLAPWSTLINSAARAPLWSRGDYSAALDHLVRRELIGLIFAGETDKVAKTVARLRLMNLPDPLAKWADDWVSLRRGGVPVAEPSQMGEPPRPVYRHPYLDDLSKEGFSLLSEFQAALDSQAYHDACQIIASAPPPATLGLMPDIRDPQRMISLDAAIDGALHREPALRAALDKQFGNVGMLQVRQAIDATDAAAVATATLHYRGTPAAAEAFLWLGDRALSAGDFSAARSAYHQALRVETPGMAERIAPRDRLAAAMLGESVGQPVTGPVRFGDVQMTAEEFENIVSEMRKSHAADAAATAGLPPSEQPVGWTPTGSSTRAPAPTGFEVKELARFDGEIGDNPGNIGSTAPPRNNTVRWLARPGGSGGFAAALEPASFTRGLDWVDRQLAVGVAADRLYVSNRFQVSAYDAQTGQRTWQTGLGGEHGRTFEWTLTPMRPLPVGRQVFVRRLTRSGPELAALDATSGQVQWRTPTDMLVASDPLWDGSRLQALVAVRIDQQWAVLLTTFDPLSGAPRAAQRIATLRNSWMDERTCQWSAVGDNFVVLMAGTVVCCDSTGKLRWVRRQEWISPQEDRDWGRQYQQPPLVAGDRLLVTQPGVAVVECLDPDSGELLWRVPLPGIHRLSGLVGDRLIVETDEGLLAISVAGGNVLWHHLDGDLLEAQLCGGPGQLAYTRRQAVPNTVRQFRPEFVWLDPATGRETAHAVLDSLKHEHPMLGQVIAVGGRLWTFATGGENEPSRTIYELIPHGPAAAAAASAAPRVATVQSSK